MSSLLVIQIHTNECMFACAFKCKFFVPTGFFLYTGDACDTISHVHITRIKFYTLPEYTSFPPNHMACV